jgi:hypothetical protein
MILIWTVPMKTNFKMKIATTMMISLFLRYHLLILILYIYNIYIKIGYFKRR